MTKLMIRSGLTPPPELPKEFHPAFAAMCERLEHSGVEILPVDAVVIAKTVQAEAALQRAQEAAAGVPLTVDSRANGELVHPLHKLVTAAESNLRSWLRLLPKTSGNGHPVHTLTPHVTMSGDVASKAGLVAGPEAVANGEPPARVQKLRAMLRDFRNQQNIEAGSAVEAAVVTEE